MTSSLGVHSIGRDTRAVRRIDLTRYFAIIGKRIDSLGAAVTTEVLALVDERPPDADRIIGAEFANDPTVWEIGAELRSALFDGPGAVVATIAYPDVPPMILRKRQLVAGYSLGRNANHHSEDQPDRALFEISPRLSVKRYGGNGENASSIGPHTDGSGVRAAIDILGLGCINPAYGPGGETLVCDALQAVLALSARDQAELAERWPRTDPYNAHCSPADFVRRPIAVLRDPFEFSYHPQRVQQGLDACGEATPERLRILSELNAALMNHAAAVKLSAGELLLINNRRLAHGRIGFVHDAGNPRRLERQWIMIGDTDRYRAHIRLVK